MEMLIFQLVKFSCATFLYVSGRVINDAIDPSSWLQLQAHLYRPYLMIHSRKPTNGTPKTWMLKFRGFKTNPHPSHMTETTTDLASEMARYMKTVKGKSVEGHSKSMYSWNEKSTGNLTHKRCPGKGNRCKGKNG